MREPLRRRAAAQVSRAGFTVARSDAGPVQPTNGRPSLSACASQATTDRAPKVCALPTRTKAVSAALATKAREAGVKIFHAPITFKADASDNPNKGLGILAGCAGDKLFTAGTWNADFCEQMTPQGSDIVVLGKKGLDGFPGTDLEEQLVTRGIETVAIWMPAALRAGAVSVVTFCMSPPPPTV